MGRCPPISAAEAAAASGSLSWPSGDGDATWWCASDPQTATVRLLRDGTDVLGPDRSVRNRVNGYGGRPYVIAGGVPVFTEYGDQRLYRGDVPLTPADPQTWYADPLVHGDEVWCIRETGTRREIVAVPLSGSGAVRVVARSHRFLSGPRVSPDGRRLAWIGWDHPLMPWDGTDLMVAELVDGVARDARRVLGGPDVSVPQAEWAGPETLYAMADPGPSPIAQQFLASDQESLRDRDRWWNLHRVDLSSGAVENVLPLREECAGALWRVGATWFAVAGERVVLRHGVGAQRLAVWDPASGELRDLAPGWHEFGSHVWADAEHAVVTAGSEREEFAVLRMPLSGGSAERRTSARRDTRLSIPRRRQAHGVHFVHHEPTGPGPQPPPLLVHVHGGPTSHTDASPSAELSFFTSRGFAVADVDYGGSTGYGRAYRDRLRRNWGIVDVADCVTVVRELAGEIDPDRVAIRGGSAGGWTTLACLAHTDVFCAGAVYYPIADPLRWRGEHTHDFESRYIESLVGELPRDRDRYDQVSPLRNADRITSPLVMLQGADDTICPPEHAHAVIAAVSARGLWHRMLMFDGEGHGFRKATSVIASLHAELDLYRYAMNIDLADG